MLNHLLFVVAVVCSSYWQPDSERLPARFSFLFSFSDTASVRIFFFLNNNLSSPLHTKRNSTTDHRWPVSCKWGAAQSLRHSHRPFWLTTKCHLGNSWKRNKGGKEQKLNISSKCAGVMQNKTLVFSLLILTVFIVHSCLACPQHSMLTTLCSGGISTLNSNCGRFNLNHKTILEGLDVFWLIFFQ